METIDLSHMNLEYMPDLSTVNKEKIYLDSNDFSVIFSEHLPATVKVLHIGSNRIYSDGLPFEWPRLLETISLDHNYLQDTDGIHWPDSLKELNLNGNPLKSWPHLPAGLECLFLNKTDLYEVEPLPQTLKKLFIRGAKIRQLPPSFPETLEVLNVSSNFLRSNRLPFDWGSNLLHLNLSKNFLTSFPKGLPDSLKVLCLDNNNITEIPSNLPTNLGILFLRNNKVRKIEIAHRPKPISIIYLDDNELTESVSDYQVKKHIQWASVIFEERNWNTETHIKSANILRRLWRVYSLRKRLRTWKKTCIVRVELQQVSMHPCRAGRFENVSLEWGC